MGKPAMGQRRYYRAAPSLAVAGVTRVLEAGDVVLGNGVRAVRMVLRCGARVPGIDGACRAVGVKCGAAGCSRPARGSGSAGASAGRPRSTGLTVAVRAGRRQCRAAEAGEREGTRYEAGHEAVP